MRDIRLIDVDKLVSEMGEILGMVGRGEILTTDYTIIKLIEQATAEPDVSDWEACFKTLFGDIFHTVSKTKFSVCTDEVIDYFKKLSSKAVQEAVAKERERILDLLDNQYETVSMWPTSKECKAHNNGVRKCFEAIETKQTEGAG